MAEEKILLQIKLDVDETISKLTQTKQAITSLKEENKKLAAEAKAASAAGNTAMYNALTEQVVKNEKAIRSLSGEERNLRNQLDLNEKANKAQAGSYEQVLRQQQIASINLKNLEGTLKRNEDGTFELTEAYKVQAEAVRKAKEAVIAFDQGIKDGRTNVGNYSDSFTDAIERTGLFGGKLGELRDVFSKVKAGGSAVKEGTDLIVKGFEAAGDAVKKVAVTVGNSISLFNTIGTTTQKAADAMTETGTATEKAFEGAGDAAKGAADDVKGVGVAGEVAGQGLSAGAKTGATAMQLLKFAIASTGIGLLVIAVGSLYAFFKKTEEGAEFLERALAGVGAVVDVLTDALAGVGKVMFEAFSNPKQLLLDIGNFIKDQFINRLTAVKVILEGIVGLDFKKMTDGFIQMGTGMENGTDKAGKVATAFGNIATKAKNAAEATAALKKEQQDLEDQVREQSLEVEKNNKSIETYLRLSKDVNISTKDRLEALDNAGKLEQRNVVIKRDQAEKELDITIRQKLNGKELTDIEKNRLTQLFKRTDALSEEEKEEIRVFQSKSTIRDSDLKEITDLQIKVVNVNAESANTQIQIEKRRAAAENEERRKEISANIGILDARLQMKQLQGQQEFNLQKVIAKQQLDQALLDESLLPKEKERIRADGALRLAQIEKAEADFRKKITQDSIDVQLSLIADGKTREIAQELEGLNRKLEAITGNSQAEVTLKESLINESAIKLLSIERKYREQDKQDAIKDIATRATDERNSIAKKYQDQEATLRIALSKEEITREQFEGNKAALTQARLKDELIALQAVQAQRQLLDQQFFTKQFQDLQKALEEKKITQVQFDNQLTQLQKDQKKTELQTLTETQVPITAKEQEIIANKVDITVKGNEQIIADQRRTAALEANVNQLRLDLAGTLVSGFKDFLGQDEKNRKKYGDVIKALALSEVAINLFRELSFIATAAAANPANAVTYGAAGNAQYAIQSAIAIARSIIAGIKITTHKFAEGGMSSKDYITLNEAVSTYKPSFTNDMQGHYSKPTMSLVAEKGPEWVSPNWMLSHPVSGPMIARLESFRRTKVLPFFDGGLTATGLTAPVINQIEIGNMLQQALSNLPSPVVIVQDINEAQGTVVKVEDRANF